MLRITILRATIFLLAVHMNTFAQQEQLLFEATTETIVVDGSLNELVWQSAPVINKFLRNFPDSESIAAYSTQVWVTYNAAFVYVAAKMLRNPQATYSIASLQRDFIFLDNDSFGIILDPFQDKTNGYGFYVNAGGAWRDEQIAQGTVANATWDTKWNAEVVRTADYWTVEFEIPFRYFRNRGGMEWNINFIRNDKGANERSAYTRVPINFLLHNLAFTHACTWATPITEQKKNISLIPSITTSVLHKTDQPPTVALQPSLDAKIALSSAVNLDVTINPDFSQTSADVFQLNLTRFELVYPENRFFFIENSDLFASFGDESWGNPVIRPFYSRRIGLNYDAQSGSFLPSRILGGARLSGKITNDLRFGAMTMFTESSKTPTDSSGYLPAQSYSVVAAQQKIFSRSNLAVLVANRQAFGTNQSNDFKFNQNDYNRMAALEYNFASPDDKISGKVYHHFEFKDQNQKLEFARAVLLNHNTRHWRNNFHFTQVSDNYNPEIGLISRNNVQDMNIHLGYSFYPKRGFINQFELLTNQQSFWNNQGQYTDYFNISGIHTILKNTHDFWLVYIWEKNTLREPFDPSFKNITKLDSGFVGRFGYWRFSYASDTRKELYWQVDGDYGTYYQGTQKKFNGVIRYRFQPFATIGINWNLVQYNMPEPYKLVNINYLGPRTDITFNRNLYWTTMVQYNTVFENLNIYSRVQWRFLPLSDLFVIYSNNTNVSDNRYSQNLSIKVSVWL
ncbi:MAG: carbohydrate binding family 9 domain-containing protein [Cyclobacteriaceae bacterium]|nr:carbohydrate binding family 9 domain-containing protein [Cyclobacteriaceae bacterium]